MIKENMKRIGVKEGYKYQVSEDEGYVCKLRKNPFVKFENDYFEVTADGWLWIKKGYAYDGASGPTVDTANTYRASAVHDARYQLMRMGVIPRSYRKSADIEMYRMLREDGMWYARAKPWYIGLRVGAGKYVKASAMKKTKYYPK